MPASYYRPKNWRAKDISNQRFGRLIAKHPVDSKDGNLLWLCHCDCTSVVVISGKLLRNGNTKSCGCLHSKMERRLRATTHGLTRTTEYRSWVNMIGRCRNSKRPDFSYYGGRGIIVCKQWLTDFETFYADMGPKPSKSHSIERRDNNGSYSPENCYWGTKTQQARNTRSNRFLTFNGITKCLAEWEDKLNLPHGILRKRIKRGWPVERALTTPTR